MSDNVKYIGDYAFSECDNLTELKLSCNIEQIGTIYKCGKISSITIPEGVKKINNWAFDSCQNLRTIKIPASVTEIGDSLSFLRCYNLENIEVDPNNINYSSQDGVLYNKDKTKLIFCPNVKAKNGYKIPKSVKEIGLYGFAGCKDLSKIIIPDNVTSIGTMAFAECANLQKIELSKKIQFLIT